MHNRNYNRNRKLFKIMTLGAMAIMMINSYKISATEDYQHLKPRQRVVAKRDSFVDDQRLQKLKAKINQAADCAVLPNNLS